MCATNFFAFMALLFSSIAGLEMKLKFYYDSSFFVFNEGYHSKCYHRIMKIARKLQEIFNMPSFGHHMKISIDKHIVKLLSEKWKSGEHELNHLGNLIIGQEANLHIFVTVHKLNKKKVDFTLLKSLFVFFLV